MVFFLATALVATEYITAAKSKGEVLVFRRGHIPVQESKSSDDEESAQPVQQLVVDVDEKVKRASAVSGLQKQTSIFHWEDVCYDIKIKGEGRRLLDNVDGWVEPGTLTALMVNFSLCFNVTFLLISTLGGVRCWEDYAPGHSGQSSDDGRSYRKHVR